MAKAELAWVSNKAPADIAGWVALRQLWGPEQIEKISDERTVYVLRLTRPFAIAYEKGNSPVLYIGRGAFKTRMTSHLTNWLGPLSKHVRDLRFEVLVSTPRAQNNVNFYKDVEASMIDLFEERYGSIPLRNRKHERNHREHEFKRGEIARAFGLGKGRGYHWALSAIGSNRLKRA